MQNFEKGFYYHYKHDPAKGDFDYAYEVLNIGHHTEIDESEDNTMIVYRPLYDTAYVYKAGKHWDVRPMKMFLEDVTKEGKTFPRFSKITDPELIEKLKTKVVEMYS